MNNATVIFIVILIHVWSSLGHPTPHEQANSCPVEDTSVHSFPSKICDNIIRVKNGAGVQVIVFWVDFSGNEVQRLKLLPGLSGELRACLRHIWRARDKVTHRLLAEYVVNGEAIQSWTVTTCWGFPQKPPYMLKMDLGLSRGSFDLQLGNLHFLDVGTQTSGRTVVMGPGDGEEEVVIDINVDLRDAYFGTLVPVEYERTVACPICKGSGQAINAEPSEKFEAVACDRCGGSGIREREKSLMRKGLQQGYPRYTKFSLCSKCEGYGSFQPPKQGVPVPLCPTCHGARISKIKEQIEVFLPPGVPDKYEMKMKGLGQVRSYDISNKRMVSGDLIVRVHVGPYGNISTCNGHLIFHQKLSLKQALHGFTTYMEHLTGQMVMIQRDDFTLPGTTMKIENEGMPAFGIIPKGDLIVVFSVEIGEDEIQDHEGDGRRNLFWHLIKSISNNNTLEKICSTTNKRNM